MKVIDHLYFLAAIKEVDRATAKKRIAGWLDKMELRPWLNKKVEELSKGMQQKVQFIATIVHDPEILILDEVFSGLDPINTALMKEYFKEFRSQGKTIIFSTHVLEQAEKLCDEICLMAESKKILHGDLQELKRQYAEDQLRLSVDASLAEVASLPGVVSASSRSTAATSSWRCARHGPRAISCERAIERYDVEAFSQNEPELEEIYLAAVKDAGLEETRDDRMRNR